MGEFKVWARWRPLESNDPPNGEIHHKSHHNDDMSRSNILISLPRQTKAFSGREQTWKSGFSYNGVFEPDENNHGIFDKVVAPVIPDVLRGKSSNFFAYGHSGSGKTHTMIGYDFENNDQFGLCLAAARQLAAALDTINAENTENQFGLGLRVYELRKNKAIDLLNDGNECFVREGPDGRVYIRGETETLENRNVRVRPIVTKSCWSFNQLQQELEKGLMYRKTATSSVHDQSSRTHAIMELEIITKDLLHARNEVIDRHSELVPVGKAATDIYIEEQSRGIILTGDGNYVPNPDYQIDQQRIDAAEAMKADFESSIKKAEAHVSGVFAAAAQVHQCIGGKLVFVDLAGAEFASSSNTSASNQSPQEKQQGRQINTDLLALKEVIRARALATTRIPYRSSPLTMVLREHFESNPDTHSAMILTISPGADQFAATMNTLKYGDLVGLANDCSRPTISTGRRNG